MDESLAVQPAGWSLREYAGPLMSPDYRYFWLGNMAFSIGIWIQVVTMSWLTLKLTDSAFMVSLVNVAWFLPFFLFAFPAGMLADRHDRKAVVMVCRGAGAVVLLLMAIMDFTGQTRVAWLFGLTFLVGTSIILELPARMAFVPQLVKPAELLSAIALFNVGANFAWMMGPLMAGLMTDQLGAGASFASFSLLSFLYVPLLLMVNTSRQNGEGVEGKNALNELMEGMRYLYRHKDAFAVVLMAIVTGTFGWVYMGLMAVMVDKVLHRGAFALGVLGTAVGAGATIASIVLSLTPGFRRQGLALVTSLIVWGVGISVFGFSHWFVVSILAMLVVGSTLGMQFILYQSILLRVVVPEFHGRVLSAQNLTWGANIAGTLSAGYVADTLGVSLAVGVSGVLIVACTLGVLAYRPSLLRL